MINSSDDSSLSSSPSPSVSSSAGGGRKRRRGDRGGGSGRGGGRSRGGGDGGGSVPPPPRPRPLVPAAPAPSDWDELRAHYRFVLPDDAEGGSAPEASGANVPGEEDDGRRYGATWQERMVQHYHSHLYKEYVLADLSRVLDLGKVGLRWRTAKEVASGRGFRTCGNLQCPGGGDVARAATDEERKEYAAAARRATGIAVPENGGREPLGVALPGSAEDRAAVDRYLASCARERDGAEREDGDGDGEEGGKRRKKEKKKKRSRSRRGESESRLDAERREVDRLERLAPPGAGLHDYEADFAYVEAGARKRELVKVRLCLRCAPLLFAAKGGGGGREGGGSEGRGAPATKAREAREEAARERAAAAAATAGAPEAAGS
ncbi:hypothetical protein ACHAWF_010425 [Thalassiosira exigua]